MNHYKCHLAVGIASSIRSRAKEADRAAGEVNRYIQKRRETLRELNEAAIRDEVQ